MGAQAINCQRVFGVCSVARVLPRPPLVLPPCRTDVAKGRLI